MTYAIVENNIPKIITRGFIANHIRKTTGRHFDKNTIFKWPISELKKYNIYECVEIRETLLSYQEHRSFDLSFDGSTVTMTYAAYDIDLDEAKNGAKSQITKYRYFQEVSGVNYNNFYINTDLETQMKIIAIDVLANRDSNFSVRWKTANNTFITLNSSDIKQISNTVFNHVQSAYTLESDKFDEIDACLTLNELRNVDLPDLNSILISQS